MIKLLDFFGKDIYVNPDAVILVTPHPNANPKSDTGSATRVWLFGLQGEDSYVVVRGSAEQVLRTLDLI